MFTKVEPDRCRISVDEANAYDVAISYGIGPNGIGDRSGFVRLLCNTGGGDLCNINLNGNDGSYVPYGDWDAIYSGSAVIGPVYDDTVITYRVRVRDNAGKIFSIDPRTNIGCRSEE